MLLSPDQIEALIYKTVFDGTRKEVQDAVALALLAIIEANREGTEK